MCYKLSERRRISDLFAGDKFILRDSVNDFKKGRSVEKFMILREAAYGFRAVSLKTGIFKFEWMATADLEIFILTEDTGQ